MKNETVTALNALALDTVDMWTMTVMFVDGNVCERQVAGLDVVPDAIRDTHSFMENQPIQSIMLAPPATVPQPDPIEYDHDTSYIVTNWTGRRLGIDDTFQLRDGKVAILLGLNPPEFVHVEWVAHTYPGKVGVHDQRHSHHLGLTVTRVFDGLTPAQVDGLACVRCGRGFGPNVPSVPVGLSRETDAQVFACGPLDAPVCEVTQ